MAGLVVSPLGLICLWRGLLAVKKEGLTFQDQPGLIWQRGALPENLSCIAF